MSTAEMIQTIEAQRAHIADLRDMLRRERERNDELEGRAASRFTCKTVAMLPKTVGGK